MAGDRRGNSAPRVKARDARGGEIILRSRIARWISVLGLVGVVIFAIAMGSI